MKSINEILTESFDNNFQRQLLESSKYAKISDVQKADMLKLFENTQNFYSASQINEGTMSSDVAQFTPIL